MPKIYVGDAARLIAKDAVGCVKGLIKALDAYDEQQRAANGQFGSGGGSSSGGGGGAAKPAAAKPSGGGSGGTPQAKAIAEHAAANGFKKSDSGSEHVDKYTHPDGRSIQANKYGDFSLHDPSGKKVKSGGATTEGAFQKAVKNF